MEDGKETTQTGLKTTYHHFGSVTFLGALGIRTEIKDCTDTSHATSYFRWSLTRTNEGKTIIDEVRDH
jgi:hypothetical protein